MEHFHGAVEFFGDFLRFFDPVILHTDADAECDELFDHGRAQRKTGHEGDHDGIVAKADNQNPFLSAHMFIDKLSKHNPEQSCKKREHELETEKAHGNGRCTDRRRDTVLMQVIDLHRLSAGSAGRNIGIILADNGNEA